MRFLSIPKERNEIEAMIESLARDIVFVKSPANVPPGSQEIDQEIHKAVANRSVFTDLKRLAAALKVACEADISSRTFSLVNELKPAILTALGVSTQSRFQYIKTVLEKEYAALGTADATWTFFCDKRDDIEHLINAYKRTRAVPGE